MLPSGPSFKPPRRRRSSLTPPAPDFTVNESGEIIQKLQEDLFKEQQHKQDLTLRRRRSIHNVTPNAPALPEFHPLVEPVETQWEKQQKQHHQILENHQLTKKKSQELLQRKAENAEAEILKAEEEKQKTTGAEAVVARRRRKKQSVMAPPVPLIRSQVQNEQGDSAPIPAIPKPMRSFTPMPTNFSGTTSLKDVVKNKLTEIENKDPEELEELEGYRLLRAPSEDKRVDFEVTVYRCIRGQPKAEILHLRNCEDKNCMLKCMEQREMLMKYALRFYVYFEAKEKSLAKLNQNEFHLKSLVDDVLFQFLVWR